MLFSSFATDRLALRLQSPVTVTKQTDIHVNPPISYRSRAWPLQEFTAQSSRFLPTKTTNRKISEVPSTIFCLGQILTLLRSCNSLRKQPPTRMNTTNPSLRDAIQTADQYLPKRGATSAPTQRVLVRSIESMAGFRDSVSWKEVETIRPGGVR